MAFCEFRNEHGKRVPGCLVRFKRRVGNEKYCSNCKPLAKACTRKRSEEKHAREITAKASKRWENLKKAEAEVEVLRLRYEEAAAELEEKKVKEEQIRIRQKEATAAAAKSRDAKQRTRVGLAVQERMPRAAALLAIKADLPQPVRHNRAAFGTAMAARGASESEIEHSYRARQSDQKPLARYLAADALEIDFDLVAKHDRDWKRDQRS